MQLKQEGDNQEIFQEQADYEVTKKEWTATKMKTHNQKVPGNFWYKKLTNTHEKLAQLVT